MGRTVRVTVSRREGQNGFDRLPNVDGLDRVVDRLEWEGIDEPVERESPRPKQLQQPRNELLGNRIALDDADQRLAEEQMALIDGDFIGHPLVANSGANPRRLQRFQCGAYHGAKSDAVDG